MKRLVALVIGLVLVGAAIGGIVRYGPYLRWYARVRWRAIEASRREPAAIEAWRNEFGDSATTPLVRDDDATAVRLTELAPAAGVDFKKTEYPAFQAAMKAYIDADQKKAGGSVNPPPDAVRAYLDSHKLSLDAIVDVLTHAGPPVWKTERWGVPPSLPPLIGLKQLSQLLVARALAESSAGRDADADHALSAAWQLIVSLRDFPTLIEQLIAMSMTPAPVSLARRLPVDAASWRVRLADYDARAGVMRALVAEAGQKWSPGTSQMERAARADYLDVMRAYLVGLRDQPLTVQRAAYSDAHALRDGWSIGTMIAVIGRPGSDGAWRSAGLVMLQLELTDRVLRARQLRAQLGKWPAAIPDIETSRIPGAHWVYRVGQDGRMSITLRETLRDPSPPLRFESSER